MPHVQFKTEISDTFDGTASFAIAYVRDTRGVWRMIDQTRNFRTFPRSTRARTAAVNICRRYARTHFPLHTFTHEAL
jgi:hypothetical protein